MEEITVQPTYLDVTIKAGGSFYFDTDPSDTLFIYIIYGSVHLPAENKRILPSRQAVLFDQGDKLPIKAGDDLETRLLLFSGKPQKEPIAWGGPIVMNTKEELRQTFKDIDEGTFIKIHHSDGTISSEKVNSRFYNH